MDPSLPIAKKETANERRRLRGHITEYLHQYTYAPRYLRGLTEREQWRKMFEIRLNVLRRRDGNDVNDRSTIDVARQHSSVPKRSSSYTKEWHARYPTLTSLEEKALLSGVPLDILHKVDQKGRAAWRGSQHRPGATQAQWGIARVNSFLLCGKTWYFPDHLLVDEAIHTSKHPRRLAAFWKGCESRGVRGKRTKSR
jgi:hypothetical protein